MKIVVAGKGGIGKTTVSGREGTAPIDLDPDGPASPRSCSSPAVERRMDATVAVNRAP